MSEALERVKYFLDRGDPETARRGLRTIEEAIREEKCPVCRTRWLRFMTPEKQMRALKAGVAQSPAMTRPSGARTDDGEQKSSGELTRRSRHGTPTPALSAKDTA
jgi:hypothetical protein